MLTQTASATPAYSEFKGWPSGTPIWPKGPLPLVKTSPKSSDANPCTFTAHTLLEEEASVQGRDPRMLLKCIPRDSQVCIFFAFKLHASHKGVHP